MSIIPFSTFEGYVKKLDLNQRSEIEIAVFKKAFPGFFTKRTVPQDTMEQTKAFYAPFFPLIQVEEDINPPRRFSGLPLLPRGRYYTICKGSSGEDNGTLVKELQAYRDPKSTGRVGIADLLREQLFGPPRSAFAVIIYDLDKIPAAKEVLKYNSSASRDEENLLIIEYPCKVLKIRIEKAIDLRLPIVRSWFFDKFSKEHNDKSIVWLTGQSASRGITKETRKQLEREQITIVSRFKRKEGVPPKPSDFYEMLPTLMNPDLGGGITIEGGAILEAIGTWMRSNEVGALIYPSARSDTIVELESGRIKNHGGWNLVDYRGTHVAGLKPIYIVSSPWAWTTFPRGVRIEVETKDSIRKGTFSMTGMEAYWRRDYQYRIKSFDEVEEYASIVGEKVLFEDSHEVKKTAAWRLGSSSIEWLTLNAVDRKPEEGMKQKLLFSGIARKLKRTYAAGWMDEIEQELFNTGDVARAVVSTMDIVDWIAETWKDDGMLLPARIIVLSNRLHVLRFFVSLSLLSRKAGLTQGCNSGERVSLLIGDLEIESCVLSENTQQKITRTTELGLELCGLNVTQREMNTIQDVVSWQRIWDKMCEATWKELCG